MDGRRRRRIKTHERYHGMVAALRRRSADAGGAGRVSKNLLFLKKKKQKDFSSI
jgi:hypothetical protein